MAKLVKVTALVRLPDKATGGTVKIQYDAAYLVAAQLAGGMEAGECKPVADKPGWGSLHALGGGDLLVYAGEVGDPVPPYLTLTVRPTGLAGVLRTGWAYRARPHVNDGADGWNLADIGAPGGPVIATEQQLQSLEDALTEFDDFAARADGALENLASASEGIQAANRAALDDALTDLRSGVAYRSTAPRPPLTDTLTAAQGWKTGSADGQRGYILQAGTATVNAAAGRLTVDANVLNGGSPGLVTPFRLYEGPYQVRVAEGSGTSIQWGGDDSPTGVKYAIWRDGGNLQVGWWRLTADGAVADVSPQVVTPVPAGDYWVEPLLTLRAFVVRVWPVTASRDTAARVVVGINNEAPPAAAGGPLRLASLGVPAVYGPIIVNDYDRQPNPLTAKTELVGAWMPVIEAEQPGMATITSGSENRSRISNTIGLGVRLTIPAGMTYRPVIASRLREVGGAWSAWARTQVPSNNNPGDIVRVDPITGLDPAKEYDVHLCFNIHESDPLFKRRAGVILNDIFVAAGGSIRALREPDRLRIKAKGDSIVVGVVNLGHDTTPGAPPSTPSVMASEWSWLHVLCDLMGAVPLHEGYGGTGVTVPGEGGMPRAIESSNVAMLNRPGKTFYPGRSHLTLNMHATNDDGAQYRNPPARPTSAQFKADYMALCLDELAHNPDTLLVCVRPFNGGFWAEIQEVAAALGLPTIDTTGWLSFEAGDYAANDHTHPLGFPEGTIKGHRKAAHLMYAALTALGITGTLAVGEPAPDDDATPTPTPAPAPAPSNAAVFSAYNAGSIDGQQDWHVRYGGSGTVVGGVLTVDAEVASVPGGVAWERAFNSDRQTIFVNGQTERNFMLKWRFNPANGQAFAVWSANGNIVEHGHVANTSGALYIPDYHNGPSLPAGDFYVEALEVGTFPLAGSKLELRTWAAGDVRPAAASYTYTFPADGPAYPKGFIALNSILRPAKIKSVTVG